MKNKTIFKLPVYNIILLPKRHCEIHKFSLKRNYQNEFHTNNNLIFTYLLTATITYVV